MLKDSKKIGLSGVLIAALAIGIAPDASAGLDDLFENGESKFNFRLRYEGVDQDGIRKNADATTLRSRYTWNSKTESVWRLGLEADYVSVLGSESFNSTENGKAQYPIVPDPEGFDLNQVFVKYVGEQVKATFGRQRILLDGQRFVGGVGWRQNEQTYDALRVQSAIGSVGVDYSFVWNVNRIFGPNDGAQPADWDGQTHLLNVALVDAGPHKVKAHAYLMDFENDNGPVNSNETYGISYIGKFADLKITLAYASQSDYRDSPLDYRTDYLEASVAYSFPSVSVKAGVELLGSDDGTAAFRTPLATLHKFQGWTDVFLNTPANGLRDSYLQFGGAIGKVKLNLAYHQYDADEGSADYGSEVNLVGTFKPAKAWTVQAKYADYDAKDFATDRSKFWMTISYQI